jgi:DNA-binding HxlR family transcriptional regulator
MLGGKYKPQILHCLLEQETHFLELSRKIKGISRKILSQQLRDLLSANLINRIEKNDARQRVEYSLTEKGYSLTLILSQINDWAITHGSFAEVTKDV